MKNKHETELLDYLAAKWEALPDAVMQQIPDAATKAIELEWERDFWKGKALKIKI